ncbi:hypothetical protein F511_38010 [Dorcoceras hygrometricum]|uniref:Splicing factor 3B subunit 1-like n=1 Tax=Dorcoceras hygrometricum TaxID=472368 RepID=A0A2Z7D6D5_9LAMI|nr:hypothetical protein F511_38010 [Dorcoceras hygrometricum]
MVSAVTPPAPKRKAPKRNLKLPVGSDDEIFETEPDVEKFVEQQRKKTTADDVDKIIDQVISATTAIEIEEPDVEDVDSYGSKKPSKIIEPTTTEKDKEIEPVATEDFTMELTLKPSTSDEELVSLEGLLMQINDDMTMPSVTATEPTKIKFGQWTEIREVDWYKASLPQIATNDKGKEPLVVDTIQGHPAREIFSLICADIDFIVQLREQVIEEVVKLFNSFSLRRLAVLDLVKDIATKEELVLTWAETDSVHIALQRRVYIISKYREMLLRKFIEARRHNFVPGTPTTAIDLKVLYFLTASHHFALKFCYDR